MSRLERFMQSLRLTCLNLLNTSINNFGFFKLVVMFALNKISILTAKIDNHACSPANSSSYLILNQCANKQPPPSSPPAPYLIPSENQVQQITNQLNQALNLGLNNPNLEQVITRIKELINQPLISSPRVNFSSAPLNNNKILESQFLAAQQTITRLEKELSEKDTPFGEDLAVIKKIDLKDLAKELNIQLSPAIIKQMEQASTYQQLATVRNAEIKKYLEQNLNKLAVLNQPSKEVIQQPPKERIMWLSLLLAALLTIGGLVAKLKSKRSKGK
ncbi:11439_t:CDS:1 [Funneliformis geosporum]|uniref:11439_t:CDS:1 n=1 Tax=Funneliformis geosporum TaxID=1117311 RepID=A0A9W4X1E8_9GLOM|nr:11439_t:CDS:1 [Funneliformis geosporum]